MLRIIKIWFQILFIILLPGLVFSADNVLKNKVVILKPESLPSLKGKSFEDVAVASFKNGEMLTIPFQFDELTEDGFIHIEGVDSVALKMEGVHSELEGEANIFDANDELLFMLRDGGGRFKKNKQQVLGGDLLSEIEVIGYDNIKRYFYLIKNARIRSEENYIFYSSELGRAESEVYSLKVNQKNALIWDEFNFFQYDGANPQKPIDTMKLGVRANVIPAGLIPVFLNNKHLKATPLGEKVGPIRATTTFRQTLRYLGAPWFASKLQIRHYESKIDYNFVLRMPEARRQMLANLKVRVSTDGRDLTGSNLVFSSDPEFLATVDGKVSKEEKRVVEITPGLDQKNWIWLNTKNNFETFTRFEVNQITKVDSKFNKPKLEFRFEDNEDEKDRPEFHKGQSPDAGFVVKMPQFGKMFITYGVDMFSNTETEDPKKLAHKVLFGVTVNEYPLN
jgi:hypothetical protein